MPLFIVKKCCFCVHLKTGCYLLAIVHICRSLIGIVIAVAGVVTPSNFTKDKTTCNPEAIKLSYIYMQALIGVFDIIGSVLFLRCLIKKRLNRPLYITLFMCCQIAWTLFYCIGCIMFTYTGVDPGTTLNLNEKMKLGDTCYRIVSLIPFVVGALLEFYWLIPVYSYSSIEE